eukprot:238201-Amorphochlora_amoeboformis.AAC.1
MYFHVCMCAYERGQDEHGLSITVVFGCVVTRGAGAWIVELFGDICDGSTVVVASCERLDDEISIRVLIKSKMPSAQRNVTTRPLGCGRGSGSGCGFGWGFGFGLGLGLGLG